MIDPVLAEQSETARKSDRQLLEELHRRLDYQESVLAAMATLIKAVNANPFIRRYLDLERRP